MEEKKVREAIIYLKVGIEINKETIASMSERFPTKSLEKEILNKETAIEALEKQLPKEIKAIDPERSEEFGDVEFCCPNCNSHYLCDIADVPNYCTECGIRFDT